MLRFDLKKELRQKELFSSFRFQGQIQLAGVCTIFGDSGAGKTSLVRALAGLESDFIGTINFKEMLWQDEKQFVKTEKRKIGMVFQEPRLFPHLDVLANLQLAGVKAKKNFYSIEQLAKILNFSNLLKNKTRQLSGGQKQRVAIACAILRAPDLLIMDEPLTSLDKLSRRELLPFIKALGQQIPIIYITHNMEEVFYLSRQMLLIDKGRVEAIGDPHALFLNPKLSLVKHAHSGLLITVTQLIWQQAFSMVTGKIDGQPVMLTGCVPSEQQTLPAELQIKITSNDIIIAAESIKNSSLQNCLRVTILQIEKIDSGGVLLTLSTGQQKLLAKISQKSLLELKLQANTEVFAYINAMSIIGQVD